ncbi:MAG: carboxypeptidase regulatory-like domain-containing protein [Terriglobales bacterium]
MPQSQMTRLFALAIFVLGAWLAAAQQSAPAASAVSVSGTVVKDPGSQPLKKVVVEFIAEDQKVGGNYTASTDGDGHFRIESVLPGRYRLFLEKTGFAGVNGRGMKSDVDTFTVQAGQTTDDLLLRMMPTATISGRITDEDGEPVSGVRVIAQRKKPGKATRETAGSDATNDLGEYRIAGLFPGQYWIVVMPPPDMRDYTPEREKPPPSANSSTPSGIPSNDGQLDAQADDRYVTTYYPGTNDAAQASTVTLKAGDEMPVSLSLMPSRTYHVRGTVTGVSVAQKPVVELVSKAGDSIRANEVGPDGQFELRGVAPGAYVLRVTAGTDAQTLTARQDINVVAADVDGVKLAPLASFRLSGHLRIEGTAAADLTQYTVNLRQAELPEDSGVFMSQDFFGASAPVDRLGNFEWKNMNPGNYIVRVYGGDAQGSFFVKSVTLGGRDVETGLTASGPAALDLVVSSKASTIEGAVVEKEKDVDNDHPVPNATVVAVPEDKYRKLSGRFGSGATDQHGHFTIRGLAPGSYTLYAWQDLDEGVYRDADFLKSQEANGKTVKVEEGSHQTVELKLSPAGEEWR